MAKFKQEVLDKIKTDPDLFAVVAKALKIRPSSMLQTVERNGAKLNQYDIVVLVASHLHVEPSELVEDAEASKDEEGAENQPVLQSK